MCVRAAVAALLQAAPTPTERDDPPSAATHSHTRQIEEEEERGHVGLSLKCCVVPPPGLPLDITPVKPVDLEPAPSAHMHAPTYAAANAGARARTLSPCSPTPASPGGCKQERHSAAKQARTRMLTYSDVWPYADVC
jgi:hypothetical protein